MLLLTLGEKVSWIKTVKALRVENAQMTFNRSSVGAHEENNESWYRKWINLLLDHLSYRGTSGM